MKTPKINISLTEAEYEKKENLVEIKNLKNQIKYLYDYIFIYYVYTHYFKVLI